MFFLDQRPNWWLTRLFRRLAMGIALGFALLVVIVSPTLLAMLNDRNSDWAYLASIGAAYGGISAILSGVALCGVVVSLVLQSRQAGIEQLAFERQRHFEIVSLALNEPDFLAVVDPEASSNPDARKEIYANLMLGYWQSAWLTKGISEAYLRRLVGSLFQSEIGRKWWGRVQAHWNDPSSRSKQRFRAIVTEEWLRMSDRAAAASGQAETSGQPSFKSKC